MKFLAISHIEHIPHPVTGRQKPTCERFREVLDNAILADDLGFDGFGVGERSGQPSVASSPPVVLSHIAALTTNIRLFTEVSAHALLDPVRAYEDYATLDHLSSGRLDLIVGDSDEAAQGDLFRRLWHESENPPCPRQQSIRLWHGGATTKEAVDLAARDGEPLFASDVTYPIEPYAALVRYYRERWVDYGHDLSHLAVGAGTAAYFARRRSQDALDGYRPVFEAHLRFRRRAGLPVFFNTFEDFIKRSSALIGSPQQIIEKVHEHQQQLGLSVLRLPVDANGLSERLHLESLQLFQSDIAPVLRRELPDPPFAWGPVRPRERIGAPV